jgi:hypothetical protein
MFLNASAEFTPLSSTGKKQGALASSYSTYNFLLCVDVDGWKLVEQGGRTASGCTWKKYAG